MAVIGIDLGGTKLAAALFSTEGRVLASTVEPIGEREGAAVGRLAAAAAADLMRRHDGEITGVGMCVPGIYTPSTGRVWAPNIPGWTDYPLRDELEEIVGGAHPSVDPSGSRDASGRIGSEVATRVRIASDRSCSILGEVWKGAARGCTDAIFLAVGTGIGAGVVAGGRMIEGRHGIAGAVGWMALDRPFRGGYESFGCFEYAASGDGIVRVARDLIDGGSRDYDGPLARVDRISSHDVFEAYAEGDPVAVKAIKNVVELWGMAAANLVSVFNPEKIIFGGGVFGPAVALLDRIRAEAERWAQPIAMERVTLEGAQLGGEAGLYGAAKLVLD